MVLKMVGRGSQYAYAVTDTNGDYLDGSKTYKLNIHANAPAKDFWSVVIYDPQTRSELQTGQTFPSKNNERDNLIADPNGSVDLYFGPYAPAGTGANWFRPCPARAGMRFFGSTVRSNPGSTRLGGRGNSSWFNDVQESPGIGKLDKDLNEAAARGWTVVSIKDDWARVLPFDP